VYQPPMVHLGTAFTPPSGGEKHSPVDGWSWGVFVVLCNIIRLFVADALTDAAIIFFT